MDLRLMAVVGGISVSVESQKGFLATFCQKFSGHLLIESCFVFPRSVTVYFSTTPAGQAKQQALACCPLAGSRWKIRGSDAGVKPRRMS